MTRLTNSDLRSVIDTLHDLTVGAVGADVFPRPVIERLATLLESPNAGYVESDSGYYIRTALPEPEWFGEALFRWQHQDPIGCSRFAGSQKPVAVSDLMRRRDFHRLGIYEHTLQPFGCADMARLFLPGKTRPRFFYFDRQRWGLNGRERELLNLLRPHFALHRDRWHGPSPAELQSLTARERQILEAVANGETNTEIAKKLWISPHTVRTHLEHIFEKLNVKTRTEAAARLTVAQ